jgi:hypothetical protein
METCINAVHQEISVLNFDWAYGVAPILVVLIVSRLVRQFKSPYVLRDGRTKKRIR